MKQMNPIVGVFCILLIICLVVLALLLTCSARASFAGGGIVRKRPAPPKSPHIVVDTLNLTHFVGSTSKAPMQISTSAIIGTIAQTADSIKKKYPGRVYFVVKDRESVLNDPATHQLYASAAKEHGVYIAVVEQYEDPPFSTPGERKRFSHASRGRDDLFMAIMAKKYKCNVLTEDRFRDFEQFRQEVPPFRVHVYSYYRDLPEKDYVNPQSPAYRGLKKPHTVRYAEVFPDL
jgi:hypothetical protein